MMMQIIDKVFSFFEGSALTSKGHIFPVALKPGYQTFIFSHKYSNEPAPKVVITAL